MLWNILSGVYIYIYIYFLPPRSGVPKLKVGQSPEQVNRLCECCL